MITNTTQELIMAKPTQYIYQWITNCNNHITNYRKAKKLRDKLKTCDIQSYFAKKPYAPTTTASDQQKFIMSTITDPTTPIVWV